MRRFVAAPSASRGAVSVETDVLHLLIDGGNVRRAELRRYPQTRDAGSAPVVLFNDNPAGFYAAQSGWASSNSPAPNHVEGFVPETEATSFRLPDGADELVVPFTWQAWMASASAAPTPSSAGNTPSPCATTSSMPARRRGRASRIAS